MTTTITADNGGVSGTAGLKQSADSSGILALATGTGTTAVTIDTSQNVGVGTSSPLSKLHVNSSGSVATYSLAGNSNGGTVVGVNSAGVSIVAGYADKTILFGNYNSGGSFLESSRFDASGNLLVGTTTLLAKLTVNNGNVVQYTGAWRNDNSGTQYFHSFNYNGSEIGSIKGSNTSTAYITSSDYRLKENVQPMTDALAKVAALKPVTYTWKADCSEGEGFIAHELAEVCPHAVSGEKDSVNEDGTPNYQGIDTSFLVATLTAAIQEQQALINQLTTRLEALEAK